MFCIREVIYRIANFINVDEKVAYNFTNFEHIMTPFILEPENEESARTLQPCLQFATAFKNLNIHSIDRLQNI